MSDYKFTPFFNDICDYTSYYFVRKIIEGHTNYSGLLDSIDSINNFDFNQGYTIWIKDINNIFDDYTKKLRNDLITLSTPFDTIKEQYNSFIFDMTMCTGGYITNSMLDPLNISRQYLIDLVDDNKFVRLDRGIYATIDTIPDDYFIFQQKYNKAIYSHMNALYFHDLTEEIPNKKTITVESSYHNDKLKKECKVNYANDKNYELGLTTVKTPSGNTVKAYNKERCICDIIKDQKKLDFEQVKKSVKAYVNSRSRDLNKLIDYAKQMGIEKKVSDFVGMYV